MLKLLRLIDTTMEEEDKSFKEIFIKPYSSRIKNFDRITLD